MCQAIDRKIEINTETIIFFPSIQSHAAQKKLPKQLFIYSYFFFFFDQLMEIHEPSAVEFVFIKRKPKTQNEI